MELRHHTNHDGENAMSFFAQQQLKILRVFRLLQPAACRASQLCQKDPRRPRVI
jgi:hypothetical protein